jgi:outer membrane protein assembly factor BamB
VAANGIVWCFRASDGEPLWQARVGGNHWASPVLADGRIYFTSEEGETTVIEDANEFKEVARSTVGEPVQASLAISGGRVYLRTASRLYAIARPRE